MNTVGKQHGLFLLDRKQIKMLKRTVGLSERLRPAISIPKGCLFQFFFPDSKNNTERPGLSSHSNLGIQDIKDIVGFL